jgi:phosphatidylserine decarboxylase
VKASIVRIAPEGRRLLVPPLIFLLLAFLIGQFLGIVAVQVGAAWAALFLLLLFLFFRDPERTVPEGDSLVLAPCDGKVLLAEEATAESDRGRVAIFMSILDVHVNRAPVTGVVQQLERRRGSFHNAWSDRAARENTSVTARALTDFGDVTWVQVAGSLARRISCRLKEGQAVAAGERFGLIYLGSRMEVRLPASVRIRVKPGQRVKAGLTILGEVS